MKTSELKKIVEKNGFAFKQERNDVHVHLYSNRDSLYLSATDNNGITIEELRCVWSSEAKTVLRALLDYLDTPVAGRRDKTHTFTEFEKQLLQEGYKDFPYITRKSDGTVVLHQHKPSKTTHQKTKIGYWSSQPKTTYLSKLSHLFKSIQWEDEEPCEWGKWV